MELFTKRIVGSKVSVFFIGDIHEGNANFCRDEFNKTIQYVKNTAEKRKVSVILMGDNIEAINMGDKRFNTYSIDPDYKVKDLNNLTTRQTEKLVFALRPIKQYIDYALIGNHEQVAIRDSHVDVYSLLCDWLECEPLGFSALGRYIIDSNARIKTVKMAIMHGKGGGGFREGYWLNHILDTFKRYSCDVHVMGHIHQLGARPFKRVTVNKVGKMVYNTKWYGASGCYFDTLRQGTASYQEGSKYPISDIGFLELKIDSVMKKKEKGWKIKLHEHRF